MTTREERTTRYTAENETLRRAGHDPRTMYPSMRAAALARLNRQSAPRQLKP